METTRPKSSTWLAVWTLAEREVVRFLRQRSRLIGAVGQPILFWVLFGAGLHGSFRPPSWAPEMNYQQYFFPGVLALIVLFTAIFATISIIEDRREGFLQGVLVAPIASWGVVGGKLLGGTVLAVGQAGLFLLAAPFLGVLPSLGAFLGALGFLTLMAFSLTALGFFIAWRSESVQGYHAVMSLFLMPLWLLSGAFFPPADAGWLYYVMWANPLTYGVAGLRHVMAWPHVIPTDALPSFAVCLSVTLLFGLAGFAASLWQVRPRASAGERGQ